LYWLAEWRSNTVGRAHHHYPLKEEGVYKTWRVLIMKKAIAGIFGATWITLAGSASAATQLTSLSEASEALRNYLKEPSPSKYWILLNWNQRAAAWYLLQ